MKSVRFLLFAVSALIVAGSSGCRRGHRPDAPQPPDGPCSGFIDSSYSFTTSATDPDGDSVALRLEWGDGDTSWSDFRPGGVRIAMSHSWDSVGSYEIRGRAKDPDDAVSLWSDGRTISISKDFPYRIVATIPVEDDIFGMTILPNGERIYTGHVYAPLVSVVDTRSNEVVETISMGEQGAWSTFRNVVALPNGEYVYATWYQDEQVALIRTSDNTVVDSVPGFSEPSGIAVLPDGRYVYVACSEDTSHILVIRTSDNTVVDSIPVGEWVEYVTLASLPSGEYLYAASCGECRVLVIRTSDNAVVNTVPLDICPLGVAASPDGEHVYVAGNDKVLVIRTSDNVVVDSVTVEGDAWSVAVLPDGRYVYVSGPDRDNDGLISVIRASDNTVVHSVAIEDVGYTGFMAVSPEGNRVYIATGGTVVVLGF